MMLQHLSRRPVMQIFLFTAALLSSLVAHAQGITVVDDRHMTVRLPQSPQRIVSLMPSLTETVCALGACERLVGVDRYSNFPLSLAKLPQVGGGLDPNIEAIVALRPDVVLMAVSSRAHERLSSLGIQVVALEPQTMADAQRAMAVVAQLLALSPADSDAAWRKVDDGVRAAAKALPTSIKNTKVYIEVSSAPYAAGEASFMGELLARLGAKNIVPKSMGAFPKINPEFVVRANPAVIMVTDREPNTMAQRPGWRAVRAIRSGSVCQFSAQAADALVRPGPRMAEAAQAMAQCLVKHVAPQYAASQ
jgi:iron complex transport system substrate-binding protein